MERNESPASPPGGPAPAAASESARAALLDRFLALPTSAGRAEMLTQLSADELLALGIALYNARHYFEAHEAWEAVWLDAPRELRSFYQGLIQVTAAFVHVTRNEYPGSVRLLAEGIDKLQRYPASYMGIELRRLVDAASHARQRLLDLGEKRLSEFDRELIPPIELGTATDHP